jgi:hypothetical protein
MTSQQGHAGIASGGGKKGLSRGGKRVLRAVIVAMRPRGHGFDQPIDDDVLREVEASFLHLPAPFWTSFRLGLSFIQYGPPIYARRWSRFTSIPPDEGRRYLASWEHLRGPRGVLFRALRTFIFLAFYQHPEVLASLEVDWQGRAAALVRRRTELLHDDSRGAPDVG